MLGDNAYESGTDDEYQAGIFDMYPSYLRTSVLWPTFGNHDAVSSNSSTGTGPYYDIFTLPDSAARPAAWRRAPRPTTRSTGATSTSSASTPPRAIARRRAR